jgi:drug/metabolite transporter (DMT)-like permease
MILFLIVLGLAMAFIGLFLALWGDDELEKWAVGIGLIMCIGGAIILICGLSMNDKSIEPEPIKEVIEVTPIPQITPTVTPQITPNYKIVIPDNQGVINIYLGDE